MMHMLEGDWVYMVDWQACLYIGKRHKKKRSCCPEVSVQVRAGVGTGVFSRKYYRVKFV